MPFLIKINSNIKQIHIENQYGNQPPFILCIKNHVFLEIPCSGICQNILIHSLPALMEEERKTQGRWQRERQTREKKEKGSRFPCPVLLQSLVLSPTISPIKFISLTIIFPALPF
jgi:hypothetical protein